MIEPAPINCYRCGQPGHTTWTDVRTLGDPEPRLIPGEQWCVDPGCVDPDGSRRLVALTPAEVDQRADRAWLDRHQALTERQ